MPDEPATFEHFQIVRREDGSLFELGRGAMGVTYKAYDTRLDGYVALKVINPGYLHDDTGRERFLREARAAAHLDHPNVAAIFHRGEEGGTYFYAMQFIEGETLDAYVRRRGTLPVTLALRLVLQAAQGLAAANARGLIHRDIKPANLMLVHLDDAGVAAGDGEGEDLLVKVIDFGLAKVVLDDKNAASLSLTGDGPIGTPYYMSPEQIDSSVGEVDARTDIYSLGVTLWYLLTGQPPFVGTQFQVFGHHINTPPPLAQLPAAVPESVRALLGRMMAKTPTGRPANTRDLIGQLRELLRAPLVPAQAVPPPPAPVPPPSHLPPPLPPAVPVPAIPPSWPLPQGGAVAPQVTFRNLSSSSTVPPRGPGVYVPPPTPSHAREWKIFGGVLAAALLLGGIPLAYLASKGQANGGKGDTERKQASAIPAASAGPVSKPSPSASAAPVSAGPRTLTVPGQYATVKAAIDAARSGDTVRVGRGTFREKLVFKAGIHLVGDDQSTTTISMAGISPCLYVNDCASGTISGFTFEHTAANAPNDVQYIVWLRGSAVQMRDCRVRNSGSLGVSCEDGDRSLVEDCDISGSHNFALRAKGAGTAPVFRNNHAHGNSWSGICFFDGAGGRAEGNTCEDNEQFGFSVIGQDTAPTITGNTVRHNKLSGFAFQKGAGGSASNNTVVDNTEAGFRLSESGTAPTLSQNQAKGNGLSGFIILGGAAGLLDGNVSDGNTGSGLLVKDAGSSPTVRNNRFTNNKLSGIYFSEGTGGTAESNTVSGNVQCGLYVTGKGTAPTVRNNQVRTSGYDGIAVSKGAAGLLEGNLCENNTQRGIGVYDAGTSPTLGANRCENNPKGNIYVEKGATPKRGGEQNYGGFFN